MRSELLWQFGSPRFVSVSTLVYSSGLMSGLLCAMLCRHVEQGVFASEKILSPATGVLGASLAMAMSAISVVVGSQSAPKLEAARQGFERLGSASVEVTGVTWQVHKASLVDINAILMVFNGNI